MPPPNPTPPAAPPAAPYAAPHTAPGTTPAVAPPADPSSAQHFPPRWALEAVPALYGQRWFHPSGFFARLLTDELAAVGNRQPCRVLDIGCGHGLLGVEHWQQQIASLATDYVGIEPDAQARVAACFHTVHRQTLEHAPLAPASIDLAYAAMVVEHLERPQAFFQRLREVMVPGGVCWLFTVDSRHYFSWLSRAMDVLGIKDRYLDRVRGQRGQSAARYDNFPTYYRCNSPRALRRLVQPHFGLECWSLHRVGQLSGYVPARLRPLSQLFERGTMRLGLPGSVLAARLYRQA